MRRKTRAVKVGNIIVGGGATISIQSMTNTDTRSAAATLAQINSLASAGCEIVRVSVPDEESAQALSQIVAGSPLPVIADIHFDYKLALASIEKGVACLRINPGNIGAKWKVEEVISCARDNGNIPIRIGVNGGSLERELLQKYGGPTAEALVDSALRHISILESAGYHEIKVSVKASNVPVTVEAYRSLAQKVEYPFHIGISEAGTQWAGTIKSAVGLGVLLYDGIGDTLRVSLTADPVAEVAVANEILKSLKLRSGGAELVSCPTCSRCRIDLIEIAKDVEEKIKKFKKPITVAVMGCVVNGPGEAREADIGMAGGDGYGLIFRKGTVIRKVPEDQLRSALFEEVEKLENS